jgi:hypothetical protein
VPVDAFHHSVAGALQARMVALLDQRWNLIENAQPSLSLAFLAVLMFWLGVIFVIAGLSSPRNVVVTVVVMLAALSLASSVVSGAGSGYAAVGIHRAVERAAAGCAVTPYAATLAEGLRRQQESGQALVEEDRVKGPSVQQERNPLHLDDECAAAHYSPRFCDRHSHSIPVSQVLV